jgi:integrase
MAFDNSLPEHLKTTKAIFVLGCTIGLRFSDLMNLKPKNLETVNGNVYIVNQSIKTNTYTRIKLPEYAVEIVQLYKKQQRTLLPVISLNQFNKNLKQIGELAGWTHTVGKERSKRGIKKELKTSDGKSYRFCDLLSSHVMRRTAITTLLIHGMPEPLVRKISGHAPGSKEFYKYVQYSETFLDNETDKVFSQLLV